MTFQLDIGRRRRLHVVGVGGPGMSAIAIVLAQMGHDVTGSDIRETEVLRSVREAGVRVVIGHDARLVSDREAVTHSSAIPPDNIEVVAARSAGIPVLTRAEMLASICARASAVGVAGTHGKTTTSSLLRAMYSSTGTDVSFIIGGDVRDVGSGAAWTGSDRLVVEADESDGTHLLLPLDAAIVTNVDVDHLDHFETFDNIASSFSDFVGGVRGPTVLCADDPVLRRITLPTSITYGSADADVVWSELVVEAGRTTFRVHGEAFGSRSVSIPLRGVHNVSNATGALTLAVATGVDVDRAIESVANFAGVGRRFDVIGSAAGATFVDDYAHLPREIAAVLAAARGEWTRVVAVFQPNRFNRMAVMSEEYADAFVDADLVIITDIYASGTRPIEGVTGELVVDAVRRRHPDAEVRWVPRRADLAAAVDALVEPGDVCISMGCGDIETLPREVLARRHGS